MQPKPYSLQSQFHGVFLGAALGEFWGQQAQDFSMTQGISYSGRHLNRVFAPSSQASTFFLKSQPGFRITLACTQNVLQSQRFNLEDWRTQVLPTLEVKPDEIIFAALPTALFFHENLTQLKIQLQQITQTWSSLRASSSAPFSTLDPKLEVIFAFGYVLGQILTQKLKFADLIPQTIADLGEDSTLTQYLISVESLLTEKASLAKAVNQLGEIAKGIQKSSNTQAVDTRLGTAFSLALYCWLSTPENLSVSLMRAAQTKFQPNLTCTITGALSGAYNSILEIPVTWHRFSQRLYPNLETPQELPLKWGISAESEVQKMAGGLFALWSGIYHLDPESILSGQMDTIYAPNVIRPLA